MLNIMHFWNQRKFANHALYPLGMAYGLAVDLRHKFTTPKRATCPVICIGNATLGGGGKTPLTQWLAKYLQQNGKNPHIISRGYKRKTYATMQVKPHHNAHDCGDEAIMLAQTLPTTPVWVTNDRYRAAEMAIENGADVIILDDGFQNPKLHKDVNILITDAEFGFGNKFVFPAGPLREFLNNALKRAHIHILLSSLTESSTTQPLPTTKFGTKQINASLIPTKEDLDNLPKGNWLVFAGIAHPQKFFTTAQNLANEFGNHITSFRSFPDHHQYTQSDWQKLNRLAKKTKAHLITTEKDLARLTPEQKQLCSTINVEISINPEIIAKLLADKKILN